MSSIHFDEVKFHAFKKAYDKAVKDGAEVFMFEEKEVLPAYAKYVIQYLEQQFVHEFFTGGTKPVPRVRTSDFNGGRRKYHPDDDN
jgi:hypothetical protein